MKSPIKITAIVEGEEVGYTGSTLGAIQFLKTLQYVYNLK